MLFVSGCVGWYVAGSLLVRFVVGSLWVGYLGDFGFGLGELCDLGGCGYCVWVLRGGYVGIGICDLI